MVSKHLAKNIFECAKRKKKILKLNQLGDKFSEENKVKHRNAAILKFESLLVSYKIKFEPEKKIVVGYSQYYDDSKLYILDFYLPSPYNLIIEIDGGYHNDLDQIKYDKIRSRILKAKKIGNTIRITNEQVLDKNFDILKFLPKGLVKKIKIQAKEKERLAQSSEILLKELNEYNSFKPKLRLEVFRDKYLPLLKTKYPEIIEYQSNNSFDAFHLHKGNRIRVFSYSPKTNKVRILFKGSGTYENGLNVIFPKFYL